MFATQPVDHHTYYLGCHSIGLPKFEAPLSDGFIGDDNPALRQNFLNITKTERETEIQPNSVTDNLRRETETFVVRGSGVCFHARTISHDVFSGQANSQVDNTRREMLCLEGSSDSDRCWDSFAGMWTCLLCASHLRSTRQAVRRGGGRISPTRQGRISPTRQSRMLREIEAGCRWTSLCTQSNRLLAFLISAWLSSDGF
jgi:hypothetical protein